MFKSGFWSPFVILFILFTASLALGQAPEEIKEAEALVTGYFDRLTLRAEQISGTWDIEAPYAVYSKDDQEIIAFVNLVDVIDCSLPHNHCFRGSKSELRFQLIRYRGDQFVLPGDFIRSVSLQNDENDYEGHPDLVIRDRSNVSGRYKPLVTQGLSIGPTAVNLMRGEQLMSFLGGYSVGLTEKWSLSAVVPAYLFGAPNLSLKYGAVQSENKNLSLGTSVAQRQGTGEYTFSFSLYWSSVSGETLISHTALNLALGTWDLNAESENISMLGSSSIQTGYEFILSNWNRVLLGPKYNFQRNAVGGYLGYMWIWDHYHLLLTLNTADIGNIKYSASEAYFLTFDMFWRF